MIKYKKEEILNLTKQVKITEDIYKILRKQKKIQKISMAKIICNLIIENYKN